MSDGLLAKYEELVALRREADADTPRARLKELARRFPGALAEIDRLPMQTLVDRRDALVRGETPPFARAWSRVHSGLRGVLAIKAWLGGKRATDASDADRLRVAIEGGAVTREASAWVERVHDIARPKDGRIVTLVHDAVAAELGVTADELRAILFGAEVRPSRR
ncbi:MAG: hypothetical protein IPJ34_07500 [Myxococcales bacterium]|nr:hypothetical protein [Myxococcales bacterium]